jgi:hypothetical protein
LPDGYFDTAEIKQSGRKLSSSGNA